MQDFVFIKARYEFLVVLYCVRKNIGKLLTLGTWLSFALALLVLFHNDWNLLGKLN